MDPKPFTIYRLEGPDGRVVYGRTLSVAGLSDGRGNVRLAPVDGLPSVLDYSDQPVVRVDGELAVTFSAPTERPETELTEVCPDDQWQAKLAWGGW